MTTLADIKNALSVKEMTKTLKVDPATVTSLLQNKRSKSKRGQARHRRRALIIGYKVKNLVDKMIARYEAKNSD